MEECELLEIEEINQIIIIDLQKLKVVKRIMYGRSNFELLKAKLLQLGEYEEKSVN